MEYGKDGPPDIVNADAEARLRFEMLLTDLSAHFVSVTFETIDHEIVDAQRRIVQELHLDRSTLVQLESGERFAITHSWHLPGLEPFPGFAVKDLPWMSRAVLNGEMVLFERIDDLPPEAIREKEAARRFGPRSNITFPIQVGGQVIGAMAFGTVHRERECPGAIVNRLKLFVEMVGSAIARTRAERAMHESENRLRLILDSTAEAIYGVDLDGRCTFCNPACVRMLGYERGDELLGRNMHHLTHQTSVDETTLPMEECRICRAARTNGGVHIADQVLWRANGTSFPVEYWCYPQWKGQDLVGAVVAFVDITPRKLAEAALANVSRKLIEAQEQERNRIARELHDDIVQRLALVAIGLAELQHGLPHPSELSSVLKGLESQTSGIAADLQSLSHELHSSRLHFLGLAAAMRGFCRELGYQQKVEVDFNTHDIPIFLSPDASLCFFRVLQEALQNAAKHSGVRHFEVRLWGTPEAIHLTISDSGTGFDVKAARESRGLGLTSMEERLRLLKGTLSIESQPQAGTTIHASVPIGSMPVADVEI